MSLEILQKRISISSLMNQFHDKLSFSTSINEPPLIYARSGLSGDCLPYVTGWAWQQCVLYNRLQAQRRKNEKINKFDIVGNKYDTMVNNQSDRDYLLFFEHEPVYTLGRGADENNLTFLDETPDGGEKSRLTLSRKARGRGSSRLSLEKTMISSSEGRSETLNVQMLIDYVSGELLFK